jgi:hypothetical protein
MENINAVTKVVLVNDIEVSEHWELSAAGSWAGIVAEPMLGDRREDVLKDWFSAKGISGAAEVGAA